MTLKNLPTVTMKAKPHEVFNRKFLKALNVGWGWIWGDIREGVGFLFEPEGPGQARRWDKAEDAYLTCAYPAHVRMTARDIHSQRILASTVLDLASAKRVHDRLGKVIQDAEQMPAGYTYDAFDGR